MDDEFNRGDGTGVEPEDLAEGVEAISSSDILGEDAPEDDSELILHDNHDE